MPNTPASETTTTGSVSTSNATAPTATSPGTTTASGGGKGGGGEAGSPFSTPAQPQRPDSASASASLFRSHDPFSASSSDAARRTHSPASANGAGLSTTPGPTSAPGGSGSVASNSSLMHQLYATPSLPHPSTLHSAFNNNSSSSNHGFGNINVSAIGRAASLAMPSGVEAQQAALAAFSRASFSAAPSSSAAANSVFVQHAVAAAQAAAQAQAGGTAAAGVDPTQAAYLLSLGVGGGGGLSRTHTVPVTAIDSTGIPVSTATVGPLSASDPRTQLFVGNLPYRVRWQDLKDLFRRSGTVLRADVALSPENRSKGYGTVLMATEEDARRAVEMLNGFTWQSRILEVRIDRSGTLLGGAPGGVGAGLGPQLLGLPQDLSPPGAGNAQSGGAATAGSAAGGSPMFRPSFTPSPQPSPLPSAAMLSNGGSSGTAGASLQMQQQQHLSPANMPFLSTATGPAGSGPTNGTGPHSGPGAGPDFTNPFSLTSASARMMDNGGSSSPATSNANAANTSGSTLALGGPTISASELGAKQQTCFYGRVLFIGNLPFSCQWQDLKDLFRTAGDIQRADIAVSAEGRSRGFGTVLFATPDDAQNAIRIYHGCVFFSARLRRLC